MHQNVYAGAKTLWTYLFVDVCGDQLRARTIKCSGAKPFKPISSVQQLLKPLPLFRKLLQDPSGKLNYQDPSPLTQSASFLFHSRNSYSSARAHTHNCVSSSIDVQVEDDAFEYECAWVLCLCKFAEFLFLFMHLNNCNDSLLCLIEICCFAPVFLKLSWQHVQFLVHVCLLQWCE